MKYQTLKPIIILFFPLICLTITENIVTEITANAGIEEKLSYPIVDTGQISCYSQYSQSQCPAKSSRYEGQDAQHVGNRAECQF